MTQRGNPGPPDEPTVAYPVHSLLDLAQLLGELDKFLRSGSDVTVLLTKFMTRRGHTQPGFTACNLIDDLCFTAYAIRRLADDLLSEQS